MKYHTEKAWLRVHHLKEFQSQKFGLNIFDNFFFLSKIYGAVFEKVFSKFLRKRFVRASFENEVSFKLLRF